ncbi:MAG: class I SAM-dependent methyltransferase [Candidatus Pelethousia sp.]|nr:class I SAM-dependent methyltransferase [Candidatus Pelethousia sp.]
MQEAYGQFASLYDPLMREVDYDGWAAYLASFLPPGLAVADCACGTGEITLRLAHKGFRMIGVDISTDMLEVAAGKARKAGLPIPFICQDMRQLALHKPCGAVVCACDGVNYLDSPEAAFRFFRAAWNALEPEGLLLFDVSSAYKISHVLSCNTFAEEQEACAYIWRNAYDDRNRLLEMELTFFKREEGGLYRRFTERHLQRAHSRQELLKALDRAGFEACVYDAFTKEPPKEKSERLQFVARRIENKK